jgi:hypothetical protein
MDKQQRTEIALALLVMALGFLAIALALWPDDPQHGSPYDTGSGYSNLLDGACGNDCILRCVDTFTNGIAYTCWSRDNQTGNFAFATDGTGNDNNYTNKVLPRNHDKHGHGSTVEDAKHDIATGFYSSHRRE